TWFILFHSHFSFYSSHASSLKRGSGKLIFQQVKRNLKQNSILRLVLGTAILILLNVIASFVFTRFDLTSEKRFTLSQPTKEMLKKLNDVVYVKVYLEGEFPSGFKRLRNSTQEMLDEFRVYAGDNIQYEF